MTQNGNYAYIPRISNELSIMGRRSWTTKEKRGNDPAGQKYRWVAREEKGKMVKRNL